MSPTFPKSIEEEEDVRRLHRTLLTGIDLAILLLAQEGRLDKKQENFWSYGELSIDIIRLGEQASKQALKRSGRWWKKSLVSIQLMWRGSRI